MAKTKKKKSNNNLNLFKDLKSDFRIIAKSLGITIKLKFVQSLKFLKNLPRLSLGLIKSIPSRWRAQIKNWRGKDGYRSFRRENRKRPEKRSSGPLRLMVDTFYFIKKFYRVLLPIMVLYAIFYFVIVRVNINFDQESTVDATKKIFDLGGASILTRISNLAGVVSSYRPSGSEQANTLSSVLVVIFSLIYIWAIRALSMGKKIRSRDAIYSGTTNLMAFLFVIAVIALQMLPLTLAVVAYNLGDNGLIFIYWYERTAAIIALGLIATLTLYFASNSIMALYASTIQGVYPVAVMRSTRKLVRFQRPRILLSLIVGIVLMFVIYLILLLIVVTYLPKFTPWMLDIFNVISLPVAHIYLYKLYRSIV
jgi:hypothetical protein